MQSALSHFVCVIIVSHNRVRSKDVSPVTRAINDNTMSHTSIHHPLNIWRSAPISDFLASWMRTCPCTICVALLFLQAQKLFNMLHSVSIIKQSILFVSGNGPIETRGRRADIELILHLFGEIANLELLSRQRASHASA